MNWRFTRGVEQQTKAFIDGFSEVIPLEWIQIFDEKELEVSTKILSFSCNVLLILFPVSPPIVLPLLSRLCYVVYKRLMWMNGRRTHFILTILVKLDKYNGFGRYCNNCI